MNDFYQYLHKKCKNSKNLHELLFMFISSMVSSWRVLKNNGNMQEKVYNHQQEFLIPVANHKPIPTLLPMILFMNYFHMPLKKVCFSLKINFQFLY